MTMPATPKTNRPFTDADYAELDPGIRELVRVFRDAGFETTDSGDGLSKFEDMTPEDRAENEESGEVLDMPHVMMVVDPGMLINETKRAHAVLKAAGFDVDGETVQGCYGPVDDVGVIMVMGLDDEDLAEARARS